MGTKILQAALALHDKVSSTFRKTAINFHYEFTVRHLANVFQVRLPNIIHLVLWYSHRPFFSLDVPHLSLPAGSAHVHPRAVQQREQARQAVAARV